MKYASTICRPRRGVPGRLANAVADDFAADSLNRMAEEYEAKAAELLRHKRPAPGGDTAVDPAMVELEKHRR
ncbi:hypothetical protein CKA34_01595 [Rhizobium sp. 11515TR]|nr:hypothetical protein CKA34_01595 [Rhizobium sp. 11515TR]